MFILFIVLKHDPSEYETVISKVKITFDIEGFLKLNYGTTDKLFIR